MRPRAILIDGYNVIRTTPAMAIAERTDDLAAGRSALLHQLTAKFARCPHAIVVVFDGAGPAETRERLRGVPDGQVIYSRRDVTADEVLCRLHLELADREVEMISSDAEVRRAAAAYGAATMCSEAFAAQLNQAPKLLRQRFRAKQGLRQRWETADEDGEPIRRSRKGNGHRAPRRRNRGPHSHW